MFCLVDSEFPVRKGIDRRGQNPAAVMLCLQLHMLLINMTCDSEVFY